jgi:phage terminase small subunit
MQESTFLKYKLVIDEWFVNQFNGTKAYQSVYTDSSDETAANRFSDLVRIGEIEQYIKTKYESSQIALRTSHEAILNELYNWAYSDITETIMLAPEEVKSLPIEIRRLITKFKTTSKSYMVDDETFTETVVELWFVSKEKAMEMIQKHTGFYEKDNSQKSDTHHHVIELREIKK